MFTPSSLHVGAGAGVGSRARARAGRAARGTAGAAKTRRRGSWRAALAWLALVGVGVGLGAGCETPMGTGRAIADGSSNPHAGGAAGVGHDHILAIYRSHCGVCHRPVEPGTEPYDRIEAALARHRARTRLTEPEWSAMADFLATRRDVALQAPPATAR